MSARRLQLLGVQQLTAAGGAAEAVVGPVPPSSLLTDVYPLNTLCMFVGLLVDTF